MSALKIICLIIGIIAIIVGNIMLMKYEDSIKPIKDAEAIFCIVMGFFISFVSVAL